MNLYEVLVLINTVVLFGAVVLLGFLYARLTNAEIRFENLEYDFARDRVTRHERRHIDTVTSDLLDGPTQAIPVADLERP